MELTIGKWGNSQGIRIPKQLIDELRLSVGMVVEAETKDGNLILRPKGNPKEYSIHDLVREIESAPESASFQWDRPVGKEVW